MANVYTDEAVVRIWQNRKMGMLPTGHVGHAATTLRSATYKSLISRDISYISWWPDGGAGFTDAFDRKEGSDGELYQFDQIAETSERAQERMQAYELSKKDGSVPKVVPRANQKMFESTTDEGERVVAFGTKPDAKINLPAFGATCLSPGGAALAHWGLSLQRCAFFWRDFLKNDARYFKLASRTHNCSGVVARALAAGGAAAYVPPPKAVIYMEPLMIERWAKQLRDHLTAFNADTSMFRVDCDIALNHNIREFAAMDPTPGELWTADHFRRVSAISFARRSGTIQKIDDSLATYHTKSWKTEFPEKLAAMVSVFSGILEHRKEKPDSRRALALFGLGKQVMFKLQAKALLYAGCDIN